MATIYVTGVNPRNHKLILSNDGDVEVDQGETVEWIITNTAEVPSIENIQLKFLSGNVFKGKNGSLPQRSNATTWISKVAEDAKKGKVSHYKIKWTDKNGHSHTLDPKIAVNPTKDTDFDFSKPLLFLITATLVSLFSLGYFSKKWKK